MTMRIQVGTLTSKVLSWDDTADRAWLIDYLSFDDPKARYTANKDKKISLYVDKANRFPSGLLPMVMKAAPDEGIKIEVIDARLPPCAEDPAADLAWLRDYQLETVQVACKRRRGILWLPTGAGKCLAPDTLVLRADGNRIRADEVRVGDRLMGPDSRPRCVLGVSRGRGEMFRIVPNKGEPWVCNDVHVLSLVDSATGTVEDVPLDVYLRRSAAWRHTRKLFQPGPVTFDDAATDVPIDPYFLGVWYGDGRKDLSQGVQVSKPDVEIETACRDVAREWEAEVRVDRYVGCPTYRIVTPRGRPNALLERMREVVLPGRLPPRYLTASLEIRRALLAGLLDTDGHLSKGTHFELVQKSESLIDDVAFLARSLGLRVTKRPKVVNDVVYWRLFILGDASALPLRIPRKLPRALPTGPKVKDKRRVGFFVEALGEGDYAGFTLDGDGRFLLGDFTVTHNTEIIVALTRRIPCNWLALVHRSQLADDIAARFEKRSPGLVAGRILEGDADIPEDATLVAATFQTLVNWLKRDHEDPLYKQAKELLGWAQGLIIDETHVLPADTFYAVAMSTPNAFYRFGLSGTPLARGDRKSLLALAALGPVIHRVKTETLIARGILARPTVRLITVTQISKRPTWQGVYAECIVKGQARNAALVAIAKRATYPAFLFVQQVEHGKALAKALTNAGIPSEFVWGSHSLAYRKSLIRRMLAGHFEILVCSSVFQEGIDVPELRSVIVGSGGKSIIATLQRLGRGMRVDRKGDGTVREGGDRFEVYDIADKGNKWLERHSRGRLNAYTAEGFETFIEAEGTASLFGPPLAAS